MPRLPHWLLLHLVILPFRPRKSAAAYASIWTQQGSPLLLHSRGLAEAVAKQLGDGFVVELGMRYGEPSVEEALTRLAQADVDRLIALPLFPQHADSSTGSALAHFFDLAGGIVARARALDDRRLLRPSGLHRLDGRAGACSTPGVPARSRPLQLPRTAGAPDPQERCFGLLSASPATPVAQRSAPPIGTATGHSASRRPGRWRPPSRSRPSGIRSPSSRDSAGSPGSAPTPIRCCRSSPPVGFGGSPCCVPPSWPTASRPWRRSESAPGSSGWKPAARISW